MNTFYSILLLLVVPLALVLANGKLYGSGTNVPPAVQEVMRSKTYVSVSWLFLVQAVTVLWITHRFTNVTNIFSFLICIIMWWWLNIHSWWLGLRPNRLQGLHDGICGQHHQDHHGGVEEDGHGSLEKINKLEEDLWREEKKMREKCHTWFQVIIYI